MSVQSETIDICKDCNNYGKVCPEHCTIYQDLKAEYLNEMEREDPVEGYSDYIDRGNV